MQSIAKIALALAMVAVAVPVTFGGDAATAVPDPKEDYAAYTARALRDHFPNVLLKTQDNKPVRFYDDVIKGKVVILQFMFTNCERYCPMVTPNLVKVQKQLLSRGAREVKMVSITVDPLHDTPTSLKAYEKKFHIQPGWQFLTGTKQDIDLIRRKLGVWDPDDQKNEHMNVLIMGNETTARWIAIEALAKPPDIVYTVLALAPATANSTHARRQAGQR